MAESRIDSIVGRENEFFKIEKIFSRRKCNNVIILENQVQEKHLY